MFKKLLFAVLCMAPASAPAHEFWLQPSSFLLAPDELLSVTVRIGEDLDGTAFRFDPRAYRSAKWSGSDQAVELSALPSRADFEGLPAYGTGLHSLTVSSFEQKLTYRSQNELRRFLTSVGQQDLLETPAGRRLPQTQVQERYTRSSKLLVHFGAVEGADAGTTDRREWVALEDSFVLFDRDGVAANQPVQIYCKTQAEPNVVARRDSRTGHGGRISPKLPSNATCLLNAVFVELSESAGDLTSDWVSLFFRTR
ncbi:hypothetical protein [Roseobacter sp. A03A-229]